MAHQFVAVKIFLALTRIQEISEFAQKKGYKRMELAFCLGP